MMTDSGGPHHGNTQRHDGRWILSRICQVTCMLCLFLLVQCLNFEVSQRSLSSASQAVKHTGISVPINPNSTLVKDILSILHKPQETAVFVQLKPDARCPRPYLRARLSGPALVMLDWIPDTADHSTGTTLKGSYNAPVSGKYHLEIVVVHCVDILRPDGSMVNVVDNYANFQHDCVEDRFHHRLTHDDAIIDVKETMDHKEIGYWTQVKSSEYKPLYTRFQPSGCRKNPLEKRKCRGPTSLDGFKDYYFQWQSEITLDTLQQSSATSICFVGASHSERLRDAAIRVGIMPNTTNITVHWKHRSFPRDVNARYVQNLTDCDKAIIAVGQWSAGWPSGKPTLFGEYYLEIKSMLENLPKNVEIFMRSINYNPLGDSIGSCPPKDWRSPMVIDGYNAVIAQVCRELNISFIDTSFVIGPMWDSAADWCHVLPHVNNVAVRYILAVALGVVDNRQMSGMGTSLG